jgi:hypothetical protein
MRRIHVTLESVRREAAHGYAHAVSWFLRRFWYRFVAPRVPALPLLGKGVAERKSLTIVVPAVEKDASALGHCLHSIREMIQDPIHEIWVVSPESSILREIARSHDCRFVHEETVLPQPVSELKCRGWVLQQFIKLNVTNHVSTPDFLVVDSDTVFLRPQSFYRGGRSILRYSDQYELLYNRSLELVFGDPRRFPVSFVTHHMLFNTELVKGLLSLIEQRFKLPWWQAILQEVDQGHPISFSEYELYGHFSLSQPDWRKRFCLAYWHGMDRQTEDLTELESIRKSSAGRLNTVSFHWHTQ